MNFSESLKSVKQCAVMLINWDLSIPDVKQYKTTKPAAENLLQPVHLFMLLYRRQKVTVNSLPSP